MSMRRHQSVQNISSFFSQLFAHAPQETEGLYWLSIWSSDGSSTSDSLSDIIQRLVVPKLLKDDEVSLVWHIRNTSPIARGGSVQNGFRPEHGGPCALIARVRDLNMLWMSRTLRDLANQPARGTQQHVFGTDIQTYELVQRFEGKKSSKEKGLCVVAIRIQPGEGQEAEVDAWYRREHLAMITATPVIIRSTRYRLRSGLVHGANDSAPLLLALHECTSAQALLDYAIQHGRIVEETPWSKRVFDAAESVERTIWDITGKYHEVQTKLDQL